MFFHYHLQISFGVINIIFLIIIIFLIVVQKLY
nr:MAG TPA: HemY protein N-terminus [Caudoviricetes sp.]